MKKIYLFLLLSGLLFVPFARVNAQAASSELPGLQYSCLETTFCKRSDVCSLKHSHRVQLESTTDFKMVAGSKDTYLTECLDIPNAATGVPETICTTGSSDLDRELFCGADNPDPNACNFAQQVAERAEWSLASQETDGIYHYVAATQKFVKKPPQKLSTDGRGNLIPSKLEWQSYTPNRLTRKFLVWSKIAEDPGTIVSTDPGQKQATLSFAAASSNCQGYTWDPEGVAYDIETGIPVSQASLAIQYSATQAGPFVTAEAGIDKVLPPGTENPMMTLESGFYRFYGAEGYYTITPTHPLFSHANTAQVTASQEVAKLYPNELNYFANSPAIFEKAGTKQVRHIPMKIKDGMTKPPYQFSLLSKSINVTVRGDIEIQASANGPATAIVEICTDGSGVLNCRDRKEFAPGSGGPIPANGFIFKTTRKQTELALGEKFVLSFQPFSLVPPQARSSMIDRIISFVQSLIPVVSAQEESRVVRLTVEPIPTYLEGYAYDGLGNVIPNAEVGIYVSFSPRAIYQTKADAQGYYQITSEYLPRDPYTIKYSDPAKEGVEIVLQTSQVLAQNNEFMIVEKIDPYKVVTESTNPRAQVTPTFIPRDAAQNPGTAQNPVVSPPVNQGQPENTKPETPQQSSTMILVVAILLIVLSLGGGVAVFMMMKKRREEEEMIH